MIRLGMDFREFWGGNFEIFSYIAATTRINSGLNFKKGKTFKMLHLSFLLH